MKRSVILISSSSDDGGGGSDDEENSDEEEELESEEGSDYSESDDPEYDDDDDDDEENDTEDSDEEECSDDCDDNRVHLQGSNDLAKLSLSECKGYLRKHHLRLSGTKEECIQRIQEHLRLKDGRGESFYPRSSFSINCTGDACKGDVVLFRQRVYKKRGVIAGKRTVAGRIVKESYGTSKQQHTFTVEVLWSKPFKNLPPLSTLLVKGRNLYRFGTYRQPWKKEAERLKVVGEKHTRGDAARHKRKLRTENGSYNDKDRKRQKLSTRGPSHSNQQTRTDKLKSAKRQGAVPVSKHRSPHKYSQQRNSKPSIQPTLSHSVYNRTTVPNLPPFGVSGHGFYEHGPPRTNHGVYQPPGYYHYNYEHHVPRSRFG